MVPHRQGGWVHGNAITFCAAFVSGTLHALPVQHDGAAARMAARQWRCDIMMRVGGDVRVRNSILTSLLTATRWHVAVGGKEEEL